jgi:hypothetical protein
MVLLRQDHLLKHAAHKLAAHHLLPNAAHELIFVWQPVP